MMKVDGQQVERENQGSEGWGLGRFLSRYAAFWVQSDAFSDITRPVPNTPTACRELRYH